MASCASVRSLTLRIISPIFITIFFSGLPLSMAAAEDGASFASRNGKVLKVLVPAKGLFNEFIVCDNHTSSPVVDGFCKAVFIHALSILSPKPSWTDIAYECYHIDDSSTDVGCTDVNSTAENQQDYTGLVRKLKEREDVDAVIGDITISSERFEFGSFTQTYIDSGIVIVTLDGELSGRWFGLFFEPLAHGTWFILVGSILAAGFTLWLLEDNSRMQQHSYQSATSRFIHFSRTFW